MDKFLLAYNPIREGVSGLYIVHCLHPLAIIEVSKKPPTDSYLKLDAGNEVWYLTISNCEGSDCPAQLSMLKRAMYWFKAHRLQAQPGLSK
jgi:hypothetical protein